LGGGGGGGGGGGPPPPRLLGGVGAPALPPPHPPSFPSFRPIPGAMSELMSQHQMCGRRPVAAPPCTGTCFGSVFLLFQVSRARHAGRGLGPQGRGSSGATLWFYDRIYVLFRQGGRKGAEGRECLLSRTHRQQGQCKVEKQPQVMSKPRRGDTCTPSSTLGGRWALQVPVGISTAACRDPSFRFAPLRMTVGGLAPAV
jgi:hypothetical protein